MKYKKHILFVFRSLGTGGSQKIQAFVANACVRNGYKVTILSMSSEKCSLDIDSKINVITLDYDEIAANSNKKIAYFKDRISYLIRFRKQCRNINPDLICVFLIDIVRLTVLALKGTSYPILASERADPSQYTRKRIRKYSKALNNCVGVVYQLKEAMGYYNLKPKVLQEVIPNPSIVRNENMNLEMNNSNELFVFGAGRLTKQKRFDLIIDAYSIVRRFHPEYRLKIYGDGNEVCNLKKQVNNLGLTQFVDFMGNVKNIFQDINDNSIFVLTSDFEGIPNVLTEALIHGVPCISTDCNPGGARLLLNNGACGEIVPCGDSQRVAEAIIKYIEDPNYAKEKAQNGKEYIKNFAPDVIESKWLNIIRKMVIKDE